MSCRAHRQRPELATLSGTGAGCLHYGLGEVTRVPSNRIECSQLSILVARSARISDAVARRSTASNSSRSAASTNALLALETAARPPITVAAPREALSVWHVPALGKVYVLTAATGS